MLLHLLHFYSPKYNFIQIRHPIILFNDYISLGQEDGFVLCSCASLAGRVFPQNGRLLGPPAANASSGSWCADGSAEPP